MDKTLVPEIIYEENPDWVNLYYAAWQSAWTHIFSTRGAPVSPYMNEGGTLSQNLDLGQLFHGAVLPVCRT